MLLDTLRRVGTPCPPDYDFSVQYYVEGAVCWPLALAQDPAGRSYARWCIYNAAESRCWVYVPQRPHSPAVQRGQKFLDAVQYDALLRAILFRNPLPYVYVVRGGWDHARSCYSPARRSLWRVPLGALESYYAT